jgi:anti-anti-sigma factor
METATSSRLTLAHEATIQTATLLHAQALDALARPGTVLVDCADVELMDASAIQVLLALERALAARERRMAVTRVSAAAADAMRLAGFEPARVDTPNASGRSAPEDSSAS